MERVMRANESFGIRTLLAKEPRNRSLRETLVNEDPDRDSPMSDIEVTHAPARDNIVRDTDIDGKSSRHRRVIDYK